MVFLTNNFSLPAITITELYRCRWQVKLCFKWIEQHLRIRSFFGTSENAVKTQVGIAVSVYVCVAIVRKRPKLGSSFYETRPILRLTMIEIPIVDPTLTFSSPDAHEVTSSHQLSPFASPFAS